MTSCGIVPLKRNGDEWVVFLVSHVGYEQYWGCPKGHQEAEETHEEAARRELKEETGLDVIAFLDNEPIVEAFYWHRAGERLLKRVLYFIAVVDGEVQLQNKEIAYAGWFSFPQAIEKVVHSEGRATLRQVELKLKEFSFHE